MIQAPGRLVPWGPVTSLGLCFPAREAEANEGKPGKRGPQAWPSDPWYSFHYCQQRPRGWVPLGGPPPGRALAHPPLTKTTRASSAPAGLPESPQAQLPQQPPPPVHFLANIRQAAHPTPKPAACLGVGLGQGTETQPPQGQRDFSLPRIDSALPPPSPTVGRGRYKGNLPQGEKS